jgi:carboxyl-terminal processing protease
VPPKSPVSSAMPPHHRKLSKLVVCVVLALVVFGLGDAVGSGRLLIGSRGQTGLPAQLDYTSVNQVYTALKNNYNGKLTETQMLNGLKAGLATATGDPYTEYFTPAQAKDFQNELNQSFSGIGAELGKDADGNLIVVSPIAGFPAEKAGLKGQDIITDINGVSTSGQSVDVAVSKIHGAAGTTVTLKILRDKSQVLTIPIVRANIQIPSVNTKTLDGNIGYIQITTFGDDTSSLIEKAATKMKQDGVKGVVLDLRDNPGGEVSAAIDTASQWLPAGTEVLQERGTSGTRTDPATGSDPLQGVPTVVLINGNSASASEITAAALHDNKAAYVIGEKSYGKGVEQNLIDFKDGGQLKVTTASWYRPNGQNINHRGITPDQVVTLTDADATAGNDTQLAAAQAYLAK